jgi:hypothetical protein
MKPKPGKSLTRHTAEMIAAELFTFGPERADRLVMEFKHIKRVPGPGWCERAVADKIEQTLLCTHLGHWIEKKKAVKKCS